MILLALHTTESEGSVAVSRVTSGKAHTLALHTLAPKTVAASLISATQQVLAEARIQWPEIAIIAAAAGPGSFTGIRIGMATAKGLAEPSRLPLLFVSSLAIMAMRLPNARTVLSAGRNEYYVGEYSNHGALTQWERWMTREALLATAVPVGTSYVACDPAVADLLCEAGHTVLQTAAPDAATLAHWAAASLSQATPPDASLADGNYLRQSAAQTIRQADQQAVS